MALVDQVDEVDLGLGVYYGTPIVQIIPSETRFEVWLGDDMFHFEFDGGDDDRNSFNEFLGQTLNTINDYLKSEAPWLTPEGW